MRRLGHSAEEAADSEQALERRRGQAQPRLEPHQRIIVYCRESGEGAQQQKPGADRTVQTVPPVFGFLMIK